MTRLRIGELFDPTIRSDRDIPITRRPLNSRADAAGSFHSVAILGLTQTEAGKKLKVYKTYVSKVEQGERKIDVVEMADLCKLYGTTLDELLKTAGID